MGPLLTLEVLEQMRAALQSGAGSLMCSLDLQRSTTCVEVSTHEWRSGGIGWPWPAQCRERTIYFWSGTDFAPVQRFGAGLIKLVPTQWGPPTFEIDGIKMLPTAKLSPWADAQTKVAMVQPHGKRVLDTCGGLGYFAAWCREAGARQVLSFEKNPDVIWLRGLNPWSPSLDATLTLTQGDIVQHVAGLPDRHVEAILHDPPRFGIAGELYSLAFYQQLARVLEHKGRLFHYTGSPNRISSNRDLSREVGKRLGHCGFKTSPTGDGLLAIKS